MIEGDDLVGKVLAGRYRVTRKLGAGGMGAVYAAVQENLGREVALKVIRADLLSDHASVERFQREAKTVSTLAHPHIVGIYDFGIDDTPGQGGLQFIAMEILHGDTLRQRLESRGRVSTKQSVGIVRDIASALAAAHKASVIHRDLKPDNIMLVEGAGKPDFVKILDFGVAKLLDKTQRSMTLTQQGMMVGTPGYMAPELIMLGISDDPRSDLYALGVLWFEMIVGKPLFEAQTPVALVMRHATEPAPRPSEAAPYLEILPQVEEIILQLLQKDPDLRPRSAEALLPVLDELLLTVPHTPSPGAPAPGVGTPPRFSGPSFVPPPSISPPPRLTPAASPRMAPAPTLSYPTLQVVEIDDAVVAAAARSLPTPATSTKTLLPVLVRGDEGIDDPRFREGPDRRRGSQRGVYVIGALCVLVVGGLLAIVLIGPDRLAAWTSGEDAAPAIEVVAPPTGSLAPAKVRRGANGGPGPAQPAPSTTTGAPLQAPTGAPSAPAAPTKTDASSADATKADGTATGAQPDDAAPAPDRRDGRVRKRRGRTARDVTNVEEAPAASRAITVIKKVVKKDADGHDPDLIDDEDVGAGAVTGPWLSVVAVVGAIAFALPVAAADAAAASALSQQAKRAAQQKQYCASMSLYLDAHAAKPDVKYLYNAAEVAYAANARGDALQLYTSILENYPAFQKAAVIRQRVAAVQQQIAASGSGAACPARAVVCGDAVIEAPETCDDGNDVDGDGCDANCARTGCGNGVRTGVEVCDDGNGVSGDGCDTNCTRSACGNGITAPGETCDDGNSTDGDGCDASCRPTACGNGTITVGEQCDDGNTADGDGCDATCKRTGCGNGSVTAGEQCDDGNLQDGDGCDSNCARTTCGNGIVTAGEQCDDGNVLDGDTCEGNCTVPGCGNGTIGVGEQCDDGNRLDGDGCDSTCRRTGCGSGVVTAGEQCDDGNTIDGDGCDATCTATMCGNGVRAGAEQCDDGNALDGDGCDANCTETRCGNGVVTTGEQCDDGNTFASDGCETNCAVTNEGRSALVGVTGVAGGILLLGGAAMTAAGVFPILLHLNAHSDAAEADQAFRAALEERNGQNAADALERGRVANGSQRVARDLWDSFGFWALPTGGVVAAVGLAGVIAATLLSPEAPPDAALADEVGP